MQAERRPMVGSGHWGGSDEAATEKATAGSIKSREREEKVKN